MHHAYLLVGRRSSAEEHVDSVLRNLGLARANNPDWLPFLGETFGINEARELSVLVARRAFGEKKIVWIAPERLTLEAQNALLKTFEEPTPDTHIFLHMREKELLLPTLLSRLEVVELARGEDGKSPREFLKLPLVKRLEFAKDFAETEESLLIFLDGLMEILRKEGKDLKRVYTVRNYADGVSVSSRAILEHLSFVV